MAYLDDPRGHLLRLLVQLRRHPPRRADDTRWRILEAAIELFAARGYAATSMRDIATAVGIKSASIYAHFDGKRQIVTEALSEVLHEFHSFVTEPLDPDDPPERQLQVLVERHATWQIRFARIAGSWDVVWDIDRLAHTLDDAERAAVAAQRATYHDLVASLVAVVGGRGRDARLVAEAILALCDRSSAWGSADAALTEDDVPAVAWRLAEGMLATAPLDAARG